MPKSSNHTIITRTAEFVSPKHPDKICDIVSDSILDAYLSKDKNARVAVETMGGHGGLFLVGEITSTAKIDCERIARRIVGDDLKIHVNIVNQSPEIARGVDVGGAGDQGIMVGYACDETPELLPVEYVLARDLCRFIFSFHPYDGKTQITAELEYGPRGNLIRAQIKHVVISWQKASTKQLCADLTAWFTKLPARVMVDTTVKVSINPAGDWSIGGFAADSGLTGRKLVIDNYGPRVPIGGGAFSGKDPSKVDRSAAYMARKIATDYLHETGAHEVLVNLAYALGETDAVDATVFVDGVAQKIEGYDLSPRGIIQQLDLLQPQYAKRAKWGHFSEQLS